jgi:anti-sigma regulatory factor (Ser/Thr protein kinase)
MDRRETQDGQGTLVVLRRLQTDSDAPRAGRDLAQEMLGLLEHERDDRGEDLILCVSELVSNAVMHGPGGELSLRIAVDHGLARVEVGDRGMIPYTWPQLQTIDGHWGLALVKELSARSGTDRRPSTVAWCEINLDG